jgi:uncharacterized membrane protein
VGIAALDPPYVQPAPRPAPKPVPNLQPSPEPIQQRKPPEENFIDKALAGTWGWLVGGNPFVRAGIVLLFFGVVFLLRYSLEQNLVPVELRLAGAAAGAATLAVLQNSLPLAAFAVGGFLAPLLTSSGSNNYIGLFSFYAILNAGIVGIAWFKSWRILNLLGFGFTFVIASLWGWNSYQPENFTTVEPFLIVFFLFYVAIAVLFATRTPVSFKDKVDMLWMAKRLFGEMQQAQD